MQNKNTPGYRGMYLERSGEGTKELVDSLLERPELPLNETDRQEAQNFESGIFSTQIEEFGTVENILRSYKAEDIVAPMFFSQAFLSGSIDKYDDSEDLTLPAFQAKEDVYAWIAGAVEKGTMSPEQARYLAKKSLDYYKQSVVEALGSDKEITPDATDMMSIVVDPADLVNTAKAFQALRTFLIELRKDFKEGGNRLEGAKRVILDVYLAKVNSIIAEQIPYEDYLFNQQKYLDNASGEAVAMSLIPGSLRSAIQDPDLRPRLLKRLDYMRNGMGLDAKGHASAVSNELEYIDVRDGAQDVEPIFTLEQREMLKNEYVDPSDMTEIIAAILRRANLLSEEEPDSSTIDRKGRAKDGLFQVITNPGKSTFEVNGPNGLYKVASEPRSLYDLIVVGGFHELTHVSQAQADKGFDDMFKIATLQGKRVSGLREAGANIIQRQAELDTFGVCKPVALTYPKAFSVIEHGGSLADATKSFYDEEIRTNTGDQKALLARIAADRVLRLVRSDGINSANLMYAEQGIMIKALEGASAEEVARATMVTCFDLPDQSKLHKYGLLPEVSSEDSIDWPKLVLDVVMPYVQSRLSGFNKD